MFTWGSQPKIHLIKISARDNTSTEWLRHLKRPKNLLTFLHSCYTLASYVRQPLLANRPATPRAAFRGRFKAWDCPWEANFITNNPRKWWNFHYYCAPLTSQIIANFISDTTEQINKHFITTNYPPELHLKIFKHLGPAQAICRRLTNKASRTHFKIFFPSIQVNSCLNLPPETLPASHSKLSMQTLALGGAKIARQFPLLQRTPSLSTQRSDTMRWRGNMSGWWNGNLGCMSRYGAPRKLVWGIPSWCFPKMVLRWRPAWIEGEFSGIKKIAWIFIAYPLSDSMEKVRRV